MHRIFQWQADSAGCYIFRLKLPRDAIEAGPNAGDFEFGHGVSIPPEWRETADTIIGQRVCLDPPSSLWQHWAAEGKKRLIMELDDNLWRVDPSNERAYITFNQPGVQANLDANIRVSHTVTVSTEPLAEFVRQRTGHPDVRVIRNAVPEWLVRQSRDTEHTLGYSGSPTHRGDFEKVARHLRRFMENNPGATYHSIGWNSAEFCNLPMDQVTVTPWITEPEKSLEKLDYSFGIAPLASTVFNQGKSDLKFLELGALGVPVVATRSLPYDTIEHQKTGLLVRREHEWSKALRDIYNDPEMRTELGLAAHEYVVQNRTTAAVRQAWEDAYTGA